MKTEASDEKNGKFKKIKKIQKYLHLGIAGTAFNTYL